MYTQEDYDKFFGSGSIDNTESQSTNDWDSIITSESKNYPNIPESVVRSLIQQESGGDPLADIDTKTKYGYARGLGQFIDGTAKQYIPDWKSPADSYDPEKSIKGVYAYLDDLYNKTGSLKKALVKYHGGSEESTDVLGMSSGKYADQIIGRSNPQSFTNKTKVYSNEDYNKFFGEGTQQPTQKEVSEPYTGEDISEVKPEDKSFLGKVTSVPGALVRGAWEGLVNTTKLALISEGSKQEAANKLFSDLVHKQGGKQKRVIDTKTGNVIGEDTPLYKIAEDMSKLVPKNWKEYDEKLATSDNKYLNPEFWANQIAQQSGNMVQAIATGPSAFLNMAGTEKGAFVENIKNIEKQTGKKIDPALLDRYANNYGVSAGILEAASTALELGPFKKVGKEFKDAVKKSLVKKIGTDLAAMGVDGFTEATQSLDQTFVTGKLLKEAGYTEEELNKATEGWKQDAVESFILGAGIAGGMRTAGNITGKIVGGKQEKPVIETPTTQPEVELQNQETSQEVGQPTEAFFGFGTPEAFKQELDKQDDAGKEFLLGELSPEEYNQLNALKPPTEAIETPSAVETTEGIPTEEPTVEQPQIASEEPHILNDQISQESVNEQGQNADVTVGNEKETQTNGEINEEGKEAGKTLLNEGTAVEQPTAEPYILQDFTSDENYDTEIAPGMIEASNWKPTPITEDYINKVKSGEYTPKASSIEDIDNFIKEYETGLVEPVKESQKQEPVAVEPTTTEQATEIQPIEENKSAKEIRSNEGRVQETGTIGKVSEDKGSQDIQRDKEVVRTKVESKTQEKVIEKPVAKPAKKTYTFDELKNIYETDNTKKRKLKNIASEAGIKIQPNEKWQSTILNYIDKFGTEEDKVKAGNFYKQSHSIKTTKSVRAKQEERLETAGSTKTGKSLDKFNMLKKIESEGYVPFSRSEHGEFIQKIIRDPKNEKNLIIIPTKNNEQLKHAIKVVQVNKKPYLTISDAGISMIEDMRADEAFGGGEVVAYDEARKTGTSEEDLAEMTPEEKHFEDSKETDIVDEQSYEENDVYVRTKERIDEMFENKKINKSQYDMAIQKLKEEFDTGRYSRTEPGVSISEAVSKGDEMVSITGTEEDTNFGKQMAKEIGGISFNGIQEGLSMGGKTLSPAYLMFTFKDKDRGTTFVVPTGSTKADINKQLNKKLTEYDVESSAKEVKKLFKSFNRLPFIQVSDKLGKDELGKIETNERGNKVVLINSSIDPKEIIPTILHELAGHFGATELFNGIDIKLAQRMQDLFQKDQNSKFTKDLETLYASQIKNDPTVLFDEWVAKRIEEVGQEYFANGKFNESKFKADEGILHKVYNIIEKLVGKIFKDWFNKDATKEEIDDTVKAVLQRMGDLTVKEEPKPVKSNVRFSKKSTGVKRKRIAPKSLSKKEKLETFATDKMKLQTATNAKDFKIRFYNFANKHFFSKVGDISPQSYRDQIFEMIKSITSLQDPRVKKALELVDEFSDYMDISKVYKDYDSFVKRNKKILSKDNVTLKDIKSKMNDIDDQYKTYIDYQTLKRLKDRKVVKRPFKKGTEEVTTPSERYQRLIDKGYIDPDTKNEEGSYTYRLTVKGEGKYDELRDYHRSSNFGAHTINNLFNDIKEMLKKDVRLPIRIGKKVKEDNTKQVVSLLKDQLEKIPRKYLAKDTKDALKTALRAIKQGDMYTQNLEFILNTLDGGKEGVFTKTFFDVLDNARTKTLKFGQDMTDFLNGEFESIPIDELRAMSESFNSGLVAFVARDKTRKVKREKFKLESGKIIEITPSQKISISMLSKNEKALNHLLKGGFAHSENTEVFKLTAKDIETIISTMTKNEKKIEDTYKKYYRMRAISINKVSNEDIGYDLASEDEYHPINVYGDSIHEKVEDIKDLNMLTEHLKVGRPSSLQSRTKSDAPLILEGVFEADARTSQLIDKYIGQALPSKQIERIIKNEDFKGLMTKKGMDIEYNTIRKLFEEFQKPATYRKDIFDKITRAIMNKFTVATLGFKIPTALMQIPSIGLYANEFEVDPKLIIKEIRNKPIQQEVIRVKDLIYKYSPQLRNRYEGHIDRDTGESMAASLSKKKIMGDEKRFLYKFFSPEGAMSLISKLDMWAVTKGWRLAELEAKVKGMEPGTQEFYKYVARRTEKLVRRTQATYDVLDRPLVLNSQNLLVRSLTMFTSQPVKMLMMTRRAIQDIQSGNKFRVQRGVFGLINLMVIQPVLIEAIRFAWAEARGANDDDEWKSVWSWLKKITAMNAQMYPLIGSMVGSWIGGFNPNLGGPTQELVKRSIAFANSSTKLFGGDADIVKVAESFKRILDLTMPIQGPQQAAEILMNGAGYVLDKVQGK